MGDTKVYKNGVRLGGLWCHESSDGRSYMSGTLGTANLMIFQNEKVNDDDPDYVVFLVPNEDDDSDHIPPPIKDSTSALE